MPKYLVTATAFRESDDNPGAFAPRTFSFEVSLAQPWNGKNSLPVGDAAFHECHRTYGFWPKHNPQIDSVVEIAPAEHTAALKKIFELASTADYMDVWDHLSAGNFLELIPDDIGNEETAETAKPEDQADDDIDELI